MGDRHTRHDNVAVSGVDVSADRYRRVAEYSTDVIAVQDSGGVCVYISPAVATVVGWQPEDVIGRQLTDFFHPGDEERLAEFSEHFTAGSATDDKIVHRVRRPDGSYVWLESTAHAVLDSEGRLVETYHIGRDVTARVAAEQALKRHVTFQSLVMSVSARFVSLAEDAAEGTVRSMLAEAGEILGVDTAFLYLTEKTAVAPVHIWPSDGRADLAHAVISHPAVVDALAEDGAVADPTSVPGPLADLGISSYAVVPVRSDGVALGAIGFAAYDADHAWVDEELRLLRTLADVTASMLMRLRSEHNLRASEERLQALMSHSSDAVMIVAPDNSIVYASPSVERLTGKSAQHLSTLSDVTRLVVDEDLSSLRASIAESVGSHGTTVRTMFRVRRDDGTIVNVHATLRNLVKDPAVGGTVINVRDVTERYEYEQRLIDQSRRDDLTGLANRYAFMEALERALSNPRQDGSKVAVLFVDLDRFKLFNDSKGHAAGDKMLTDAAGRLQELVRSHDLVARFGGDEFVVLCHGVSGRAEAERVAHRVSKAMTRPFHVNGESLFLTASIGVSIASDGTNVSDLVREADMAMFTAKQSGRNQVVLFTDSMAAESERRLAVETELRRAVERGEFKLVYQPIVDLKTGKMTTAESLLRWDHPERGRLGPYEFLGVAEETGMIELIGAWVLAEACRQMSEWKRTSPDLEDVRMHVNVSARQLVQPSFLTTVRNVLAGTGIDPSAVCFEITESILVSGEAAADALLALQELGISISIDDFGTGHSSLTYLRKFAVSVVKIDKSFVDGLCTDENDAAIVAAVINLSHTLGIKVVAEGVEDECQLRKLIDLGCDYAQGYLLGRPMDPERLAQSPLLSESLPIT